VFHHEPHEADDQSGLHDNDYINDDDDANNDHIDSGVSPVTATANNHQQSAIVTNQQVNDLQLWTK